MSFHDQIMILSITVGIVALIMIYALFQIHRITEKFKNYKTKKKRNNVKIS